MNSTITKWTKTRKYLLLAFLGGYGAQHYEVFANYMTKKKLIVNAYLGDTDYVFHEYCIYLLCDSLRMPDFYKTFLSDVRTKSYYKDDYIVEEHYHMLVVKIPTEYYNAYDKFLQSKYSEMYTKRFLVDIYRSENPNRTQHKSFYVLTGDEKLREQKAEDLCVDPSLLKELDDLMDYNLEMFDKNMLKIEDQLNTNYA